MPSAHGQRKNSSPNSFDAGSDYPDLNVYMIMCILKFLGQVVGFIVQLFCTCLYFPYRDQSTFLFSEMSQNNSFQWN